MFKWVCYFTAVTFASLILLLLYDLKQDVTSSLDAARAAVAEANEAVATVNSRLPEILSEVKEGTETLALLAEDVELIKSVAGIQNDDTERGLRPLARYADDVQTVLAEATAGKNAVILLEEIIGSELKEVDTAEEFLVNLNKEMIALILPLAKSKQEILYRICHSAPPRRKPFYIQFPNEQPVSLEEFIKQEHAESAALPDYQR